MKSINLVLLLFCFSVGILAQTDSLKFSEKPKISFTFDDGSTNDYPGYSNEYWNNLLLATLKKHELTAILFVKGSNLSNTKGDQILSLWDASGHKIANHTYSHKYFNSPKVTLEGFQKDFLKNDSLIKNYSNFYPFFRFPYLKEGETKEKIDGFRAFLTEHDYKNGHVTIDASDWYIDSRLVNRLKEDSMSDISGYRQYYLDHLYNRAIYYDSLSTLLTGRKINHSLLLHHNLSAGLFLDDLIDYFKEKGWDIIDADEAYKDPIYDTTTSNIPAGESLIWAIAKQSGKYESVLRYPAEDGEYEKIKMDLLGL